MAELCFLRHGPRADLSNQQPLKADCEPYDALVSENTVQLVDDVANHIIAAGNFAGIPKKNVYIHFSPYLRCCQSADLLVTAMGSRLAGLVPDTTVKFHLLCDFALSEWIHDRMKNQPPFIDSTEAYQMYTPNIQGLQNKRLVLNFRPTTQLGPWNEPHLSYKEFLERCKTYTKKLLATYEGESHQHDMIIVVTHGYVISSILSYFINHPVFEEIPEFGVNYANKRDGHWVLEKDCLGILERDPHLNGTLNLETDIIYYKTNFIKKDDFDPDRQYPAIGFLGLKKTDQPRLSFRIQSVNASVPKKAQNPLCSGARDWNPQDCNKFKIKAEFKMKVMHDSAFKKAFSIENRPLHPISPEVSPNLAPTRTNSTVNLSKLHSNDEIYHPLKLRYSLASDIPVAYLNSKLSSHVNSQLSLLYFNHKSSDGSYLDLLRNGQLLGGLNSPRDQDPAEALSTNMHEVISRLSRVRSLQRRRTNTPKFGAISENESDQEQPSFALQFNSSSVVPPRNNLVNSPPPVTNTLTKPSPQKPKRPQPNRSKSGVFYSFSGSSSDEDLEEEKQDQYMWFGQNAKR
ncbi:hypothetical protein PUMCH_001406 [Australozyma saopauloensis]|uniref:Uncharacterized protein n=1 Tax=Australozyma saopauloensis TaxID=291208 RepID=A0AAX4H6D6_9ASCO|nr:hypothetical protein PUMCH_001406 [[Candida] saopauloensis]